MANDKNELKDDKLYIKNLKCVVKAD